MQKSRRRIGAARDQAALQPAFHFPHQLRVALKVLPFARAPTPNNANVSCKGREQKARLDKFSFRFEISG